MLKSLFWSRYHSLPLCPRQILLDNFESQKLEPEKNRLQVDKEELAKLQIAVPDSLSCLVRAMKGRSKILSSFTQTGVRARG